MPIRKILVFVVVAIVVCLFVVFLFFLSYRTFPAPSMIRWDG